ncbi:MAG TPA: glycosyltransferase [Terriglobia bacterium]|nr:glycosyltransferase [Terriglobia bacterium]
MSTPRVSVCIPTFNRARYLRAAIESVLGQNFRDLEVIVSDDGSSDQTSDLVRSMADARFRYTRNPSRLGLWANTNQCLARASGKYVIILQDDDALLPGLLRREVEVLESEPGVVLVHAAARRVDADSHLIDEPPQSWPPRSAGLDFVSRFWSGARYAVAMSSAMFRKSMVTELGGFNADLLFSADADLWQRMAFKGQIAFLNEPLIAVRFHAGQVTSKILLDHGQMLEERLKQAEATRKLLAAEGANLDPLIRRRLSQCIASDLAALRSLDGSTGQVLQYCFAGIRLHPAVVGSFAFYRSFAVAMLPPSAVRSLKRIRGRWWRSSRGSGEKGTGARTIL